MNLFWAKHVFKPYYLYICDSKLNLMNPSIKTQIDTPNNMKIITSPEKSKNLDMIIALAVFLFCCLISFTETKEVAEVLFSNVRP